MTRHLRMILFTLVTTVVSAIALAGCGVPFGSDDASGSDEASAAAGSETPGVVLDEPYPAPDFTLTTHEGEPFRLSDHQDQAFGIFFGYTGCPDICPLTLGFMAHAAEELGRDAEDVTFLLITVDPDRDDPERLQRYISRVDAPIIALTGERDELEQVWDEYDITVERRERDDGSYLVDHSGQVWLVAPNGELTMFTPMGADGDDLTGAIRWLLDREV